ncbi:hypothetical protein WICMUC_003791 [Wickerhamomyces mucosus]|uniref:Uncharacterized protein n=1 Tax=Wickerhamomyces mucosus TaxID=1378264 RepID=A0A9P8PJT1_9ASCO|nr:hypothetical protein WICMUC_003791 [Wickerhamomyces mucosus]
MHQHSPFQKVSSSCNDADSGKTGILPGIQKSSNAGVKFDLIEGVKEFITGGGSLELCAVGIFKIDFIGVLIGDEFSLTRFSLKFTRFLIGDDFIVYLSGEGDGSEPLFIGDDLGASFCKFLTERGDRITGLKILFGFEVDDGVKDWGTKRNFEGLVVSCGSLAVVEAANVVAALSFIFGPEDEASFLPLDRALAICYIYQ